MNDRLRHTASDQPATSSVSDAYLAHIERAVVGIEPTTVRLYRREARRFAAWCSAGSLGPFRPSATEIARYLTEIEATPRRAAGIRSALRAVARVAGIPTDEHGLRTGDRSALLGQIDAGTRVVIDHVLGESRPERLSITRSALTKLAAWAFECEVDLLALAPADLDDYQRWLVRVGNRSNGDLMVVARRFLRAACDPSARIEVARARRARPT